VAVVRGIGVEADATLELHLPDVKRPPLVLILEEAPEPALAGEVDAAREIAASLARGRAAAAVLRLPPEAGAAPARVRAALSVLAGRAAGDGFDPERVFLLGRGRAAAIAIAIALEREPGARAPAGAIAVCADAAPPHVSPPPAPASGGLRFLLLAAEREARERTVAARRLSNALRAAGHAETTFVIADGRDAGSILRWKDPERDLPRRLILDLVGATPLPGLVAGQLAAEQSWRRRPLASAAGFWTAGVPVRSLPVDLALRRLLAERFDERAYELRALPLEEYHAIDLLAWLDARPAAEVGAGRRLTITNLLGQRMWLTREQLLAHRPLLVIGLDDEREPFRLTVAYRSRAAYSWIPEDESARPWLARPLGAFLHFPRAPAEPLVPHPQARFALTPASFRLGDEDPLAAVADLPPPLADALVRRQACLSCHELRGAGARAHHVDAASGALAHGRALALEDYPPEVLRSFLFDQEAAARRIGARPLAVPAGVARALEALVREERERRRD
jgi:hypothetical protein